MNIAPEKQFTKTDDPISIEIPIKRPTVEPVVVQVMEHVKFDHAHPPVENEVTLPKGNWEKVILTITGDQEGRQFDRIMHIWAGNTQIFAGCTPEPTKDGIMWKLEKDITLYLPILSGKKTFTTQLENYMDELHTGIPNMSFYLEFFPSEEKEISQKSWEMKIPDSIIPILNAPKPYMIEKDGIMDVPLTLPNDMKELYLDLYVIHQNKDEFFWSLNPAFREVEIFIDDQPAGVIWPEPILYTGGVNPLLYRPVSGLRSMNLPTFIINLTPFAGLLGGEHKLSIRVENNMNYWLIGGSLFLYQNNGIPTKGKIVKNTMQFPSHAYSTKTSVLDSEQDILTTEEAKMAYVIEGEIETEEGLFTSKIESSLQYSNDKSSIESANWQIDHGAQVVTTDETLSKSEQIVKKQHRETTYTLDCSSSYIRDSEKKGISMNSNLSQIFTEVCEFDSLELAKPYNSTLHLNSQAYAVLQRMNEEASATHANTTAHINFQDSANQDYQKTIMTRGGRVYYVHETK